MNEVFQPYLILRPLKKGLEENIIERLEVTSEAQTDLQKMFQALQESWGALKKIDFNPSYTPEPDEVFSVPDFQLSDQLKNAASKPQQVTEFKPKALTKKSLALKAILCVHKDVKLKKSTYFLQLLDKRHILDKKKWYPLVFLHDKYAPLHEHALAIGDNLTALIGPDNKLLFRSFRDASQAFDLASVFVDATDDDITGILTSSKVVNTPAEIAEIIKQADNITRKRFAIVQHEGTLSNPKVKPPEVAEKAKEFGIAITLEGTPPKLVFPTEKEKLRVFLKFLCQDFYESILTGDRCVSNSHRKVD